MCSKSAFPTSREPRRSEQGVALIAAVFVIVVLALVGTVLVRVAGSSLGTADRELASTRALFAARTAAEWGLYQALRKDSSPLGENALGSGELADCSASVKGGTDWPYNSAGFGDDDIYLYELVAAGGCHQGSQAEVNRQVQVTFWSTDKNI